MPRIMLLIMFLRRGSAQTVVPAPVAAATSSGGGMHEQTINLVQGVSGELASSSSASVPVASNMSIIYCEYTFVKGAYFTCELNANGH